MFFFANTVVRDMKHAFQIKMARCWCSAKSLLDFFWPFSNPFYVYFDIMKHFGVDIKLFGVTIRHRTWSNLNII